MILESFTKEELLSTFKKVVPVFKQRAQNYMFYNERELIKKTKSGSYYKSFSGVIDCQRYYYNVEYIMRNGKLDMGNGPLMTVVSVGRRNLVVEFHEWADPNSTDGSYIKILTEHFLTRFCERMGLDVESMSILEKSNAFGHMEDGHYCSTILGDFIHKYEATKLSARFLDTSQFKTWYGSSCRGDIAIVEQYGTIPVWRTFISKEMLYDDQVNDSAYKVIKERTEKQIKENEMYIPDCLFEEYKAQKK